MPISAHWHNNEKTIMCWTFEGDWTWDDYRATLKESNQMLATVNYVVDILVDMQRTSVLPKNAFSNFRNIDRGASPNRGQIVVISENAFIYSMIQAFNRVLRLKGTLTMVKTEAEAEKLLNQLRRERV